MSDRRPARWIKRRRTLAHGERGTERVNVPDDWTVDHFRSAFRSYTPLRPDRDSVRSRWFKEYLCARDIVIRPSLPGGIATYASADAYTQFGDTVRRIECDMPRYGASLASDATVDRVRFDIECGVLITGPLDVRDLATLSLATEREPFLRFDPPVIYLPGTDGDHDRFGFRMVTNSMTVKLFAVRPWRFLDREAWPIRTFGGQIASVFDQ